MISVGHKYHLIHLTFNVHVSVLLVVHFTAADSPGHGEWRCELDRTALKREVKKQIIRKSQS